MKLLRKQPGGICDVPSHHSQIQDLIDSCTVEATEPTNWASAIRFPDQASLETLVFVFNQIGRNTEREIESPEKFIRQSKEGSEKVLASETSRTLSFPDSKVKFTVRPSSFLSTPAK